MPAMAAQIGPLLPEPPVLPQPEVMLPAMAAQIGPFIPVPVPPVLPQPEVTLPAPAAGVQPAALRNFPAGYLPVVETQARYRKIDLKNMDLECPKCGALHWACERLAKSRNDPATYVFGTCCLDGKVKLPVLQKPP